MKGAYSYFESCACIFVSIIKHNRLLEVTCSCKDCVSNLKVRMWFCRKIFDCWVPTLSNICALGWIQAKYQPKAFLFDLRLSFSRICFPVFNLIRQGIWQAHFCIICHYYILTLATWPLSHKKSLWKDKYLKRIKDIQTHTKIQIISIQLKKKQKNIHIIS